MLYGKLIDALLPSLKNTTDNAEGRKIAGRYINLALKELYLDHPWVGRKKTANLLLIPNYITGTCTVTRFTGTNESVARTVTFGGGASLTANMQGRFFQVQDSSHWHKIVNAPSSGTAYLDTPVTDVATGGGKTFKIWKRFYYVVSEAVTVLGFRKWSAGKINFKASQILESEVANIDTEGAPYHFSDYGIDPYESTYSTGTISISADDNVVTGVGTSFLGNADTGDILIVNQIYYRIKRVESDTRIILYNFNGGTAISGSTYEIKKDNPLGYQFYYNSDDYRVLQYDYLARAYDMINEDNEQPPLPEDFDKAILSRAESLFLKDKDDPKWASVLQLYVSERDGKKITSDPVSPTFYEFSPRLPYAIRGGRS